MDDNHPDLWRSLFPVKAGAAHKYDYGHAVIYGAPELTGATRLAACACARMGAGLVSVLAPAGGADIYRCALPAHIMVRDDLSWDDTRVSAKLYGPGGVCVVPDFAAEVPVVLDADALADLPERLPAHYVLTPHEGEFARAFSGAAGSRVERAVAAARGIGAHVVLKGEQSVIAAPDGRCVVNRHDSPWLASAGTGDVLAGMITGLLAQGMPVFEAVCAAVWIHGECGRRFGAGLVASDLVDLVPEVLGALFF